MRTRYALAALATLLFTGAAFLPMTASAGPLNCSAGFQVQQTFANGASWEMCWERRSREGIVFKDVHYTTPDGLRLKVLAEAGLAQIHVPYDDNGARYHDVSDYGLGTDSYMNNLQAADCPAGTRIQDGTRNVICRTFVTDELRTADGGNARIGETLSLFSVSHVGAYNYIPEWRFLDDGTIEPTMGATGRLQRYTANAQYGWLVRDAASSYGVSHLHNYYWRLDFDLGDDANDDVFEEIEFAADDANSTTRTKSVNPITIESARSIDPAKQRFWRVKDNTLTNAQGQPVSYDIVALNTGHRDTGPSSEPWTFNDVYVTQSKACERFISHNPADATGGCAANEDVTDFVNGQSLSGEDLIVWFGLTFHHIPRDEDEAYMHAHWNNFRITPRDWTAGTVTPNNAAPVLTNSLAQSGTVGDSVSLQLAATDADGDPVSYSASNLPNGLSVAPVAGLITGTLDQEGVFSVTVAAADDRGGSDTASFQWTVTGAPNQAPVLSVLSAQSAAVGSTTSLQLSATDPDGDTLMFAATGLPPGLALNGATGLISGTPTSSGAYNVQVVVSDPDGAQDSGAFAWQIDDAPNAAPVITGVPNQSSVADSPVALQISASDADGDGLSFSAAGLPSGLAISAGGLISGTPVIAGSQAVTITVTDGNGGSDAASFTWVITAAPSACPTCVNFNTAGNVSYSNQDFTANSSIVQAGAGLTMTGNTWRRTTQTFAITANTVVEFDFTSTSEGEIHGLGFDADDGLSSNRIFKVHGTQNWGISGFDTYSGGTQHFQIPVGQSFTGAAMYLVLVNDKDSGTEDNNGTFSNIRIYENVVANQSPTLSVPAARSSAVGTAVDFTLSATDPEGGALQYSATGLPAGLSLDTGTGRITGTPGTVGVSTVNLVVTDDQGASDTGSFQWTITSQPNRDPVVNSPGAQSTTVDTSVNLQLVATDPDGDSLTFSATGMPPGLSISGAGLISGVANQVGAYTTSITVTDPEGAIDQATISWQVTAAPSGCSDCINLLVAGNVSYSNQDITANATIVDDGLGLSMLGNTWRRTTQSFVIAADTILEFDFESSSEGEIHAIGFDEDNSLSSNRIFRVHGTQAYGIAGFDTYSGGVQHFQIPIGLYYTGNAMQLVLVNDKDSGTLNNNGIFRNIRLIQGGSNVAPMITPPGDQTTAVGTSVDLAMQASDVNGDSLTYSATGLPDGLSLGNDGRVTGTAVTMGTYAVTVSVDDGNGGDASASFSWAVTDGCSDCVDFSVMQTVSFATQDSAQNMVVLDGGEAVRLTDNTWRRTVGTYQVTANTVVEFEFSSTAEGEIHGIAFDEDNALSSNRIFKVHGTQNYGWTDFDNYAGGTRTYRIPVGTYYTGAAMYLVLVNDNDAGSGNQSVFRNIRIFEE